MKYFKILAFLICSIGYSQCPSTPIVLTSQADINNFTATYPGCTQILNGLTINGTVSILNLSGLSGITAITGDFIIGSATGIQDLQGLEDLTTIDGDLEIIRRTQNCIGLSGLTMITGDFIAKGNRSFEGLSVLASIGGDFNLRFNDDIVDLSGLNSLTTVSGDVEFASNDDLEIFSGAPLENIGGNLSITGLNDISNYNGFQTLQNIGGNLAVPFQMLSLTGLENLQNIGGNFDLLSTNIPNIDPLTSLVSIGGDFRVIESNLTTISNASLSIIGSDFIISENSLLTNIEIENLTSIQNNFVVNNNPILQEISGFDELATIGNNIDIFDNFQLMEIPNFSNLLSIPGSFIFDNNDSLVSLNIFPNLNVVGNDVTITNALNLDSISGFSSLETMNGSLRFDFNSNLTSISGFNNLNTIGGDGLNISQNSKLQSVNAFNVLTTVEGFEVSSNVMLQTFIGGTALETINGDFILRVNNQLSTISQFSNITTITGDLIVSQNNSLVQFEGFELLPSVGGNVRFTFNNGLLDTPNFNSLNEIGGDLEIRKSNVFTDTDGFSQLQVIGIDLLLEDNENLVNIEGFNNLESIGEDLLIEESKIVAGFDSLLTIGGSFKIEDSKFETNEFNGMENLQSIGGNFVLFDNAPHFENFYWPSTLTSVGGINIVSNIGLETILDINVLETIENNIQISSNGSAFKAIEIPNIEVVPGQVVIRGFAESIENIDLGSLVSVGSDFTIDDVKGIINLENLETVGGNISFDDFGGGGGDVEPRVNLIMNSITSIGGDVELEGAFLSLSGWIGLTEINGELFLDFDYNLETVLDGLNNIETIEGDFILIGDFENVNGLQSLTEIGGTFRVNPINFTDSPGDPFAGDFTGLSQLNFIGGDFLPRGPLITSFIGLEGLETIDGNFQGNNINSITSYIGLEGLETINGDFVAVGNNLSSFDGLEALSTVNGSLEIINNPVLTDLTGISNLDYNLIDELRIINNVQLSMCSIISVCGFLQTNTDYVIANNANGCTSDTEIIENCDTNDIIGTIAYDFDNNGCDVDDYSANSILVKVTNGVTNYNTLTDENGNYKVFVGEGTFTINVNAETLPNDFVATPDDAIVTFSGFQNEEITDFCLTASSVYDDLKISFLPTGDARPGFDSDYILVYENIGTTVLSGDLTLQFDTARQTFLTAIPQEDNINDSLISWSFTDLTPFQSEVINISFNNLPPPINLQDDILNFIANITIPSLEITPEDNVQEVEQIMVNSFDPNDKLVAQGEAIFEGQVGDYLDYVVRFQNTGTASAINVRVDDVLSNDLNWDSIRILSASHSYRVEILDGNLVSFIFEDINLPPEIEDSEGSNGYIAFQIRSNSDLVLGDSIENTAGIFFDFNEAIITNTTITTVVEPLGVDEFLLNSNIKIYPNPVSDFLNIDLDSSLLLEKVEVYSLEGKKVKIGYVSTMDLNNIKSGLYILKVYTDKGTIISKVIKE